MSDKVKFTLNTAMIRAQKTAKGLDYPDIEFLTEGKITVHQLKHFMNRGLKADEETIRLLASVLECDMNQLIQRNELISEIIPFEINVLVEKLYERKKEDIQPIYLRQLDEFRENNDLKGIITEAHKLFSLLTSGEDIYEKPAFAKALGMIADGSRESKCICNSKLTALHSKDFERIIELLQESRGEYKPQQVMLIFLYVLILFDAIFLTEAVCSTAQLMPERTNDKADQYFDLTNRSEKLRNTLIEKLVYKGEVFDATEIEETGKDEKVMEGIILLLAACEGCYQHLHTDYTYSEYVNRATLGSILKRLENLFYELGIEIPSDKYFDIVTSRFSWSYLCLKSAFAAIKPERPRLNKSTQDMLKGYIIGQYRR
jgi:hypothetical protein